MRNLATLLLIIIASFLLSAANRAFDYEPAISELRGELLEESRPGPPNYGERLSDSIERVFLLELDKPIDINAAENDELNTKNFHNITELQLAGDTSSLPAFVGKTVRVRGKLFQGHNGHHYTDVVMSVESIEVPE